MDAPFRERRAALEKAVTRTADVHVTPATDDDAVARGWFTQFEGAGLDGVVAKPLDLPYSPDKRVMFKIKHARTADCVLAGIPLAQERPDRRLAGPRPVRRATNSVTSASPRRSR